MNSTIEQALLEFIAEEERVTDSPSGDLGYGTDISCSSDITEQADEVDPFSQRALSEALVRRLDCPRGGLPDDADYGLDIRGMVNRGIPASDISSLAGQIRTELLKDDRVDDLRVTVAPTPDGNRLDIRLEVTPIDPTIGGFSLTFAVTSADILIDELIGE